MTIRVDQRRDGFSAELMSDRLRAIEGENIDDDSIEESNNSLLAATFRLEGNEMYSVLSSLVNNAGQQVDPGFNPLDEASLQNFDLNDDEFDDLIGTVNKEHYTDRLTRMMRRRQDIATVGEAGALALPAFIASAATSPTTMIGAGTILKSIKTGSAFTNTALATTAAGVTSAIASEGLLSLTQEGRTDEETINNLIAASLFSGFIGVGGGVLAQNAGKQADKMSFASQVDPLQDVDSFASHTQIFDNLDNRSIGAAQVEKRINEKGFADSPNALAGILFKGNLKVTSSLSPVLRTMQNGNDSVRDVGERLMEIPLKRPGVGEQAAPRAVETLIGSINTPLASVSRGFNDQYKAYLKSIKGTKEERLTKEEFGELVAKAGRREDLSDNPFVQASAQAMRKTLTKPLLDDMIELKMLPEDIKVETAPSYVMKVRLTDKIKADQNGYKEAISPWARTKVNEQITVLKSAVKRGKAAAGKAGKLTKRDEQLIDEGKDAATSLRIVKDPVEFDQYVDEVLDEAIANILNTDHMVNIPFIKTTKVGPLKDRTLDIPDALEEDFLLNDPLLLAERMARTVKPSIELQRAFGTTDFEVIRREATDALVDAKKGKSSEEIAVLQKDLEDGMQDLEQIWDITKGTYRDSKASPNSVARRALSTIRDLTFLSTMGKFILSALPDAASMTRMGMGRLLGQGLKPVMKDLIKTRGKMSASVTKAIGKGVEADLALRARANFNLNDPFVNKKTFAERLISNSTATFAKVSAINLWNDTAQTISSVASAHRIIGNLSGNVPKRENEYMNFLGLSKNDRVLISEQLDKHGVLSDEMNVPNVDRWDNTPKGREASRAWQAAIAKDTDINVPLAKVGDAPLATNTMIGKVWSQFMKFALASNQRILLSLLQQGDKNALMAATNMVALGMLAHYLKTPADRLSDNPEDWVAAGIESAGILSYPFYLGNLATDLGDGAIADDIVGNAGPGVSYAANVLQLGQAGIKAALGKGFTQTDIKRLRRMLPYQNLIWLVLMENAVGGKVQDPIIEGLDIPVRRR